MAKMISSVITFKNSLGDEVQIEVNNQFQDINFDIDRKLNSKLVCTPGSLRETIKNNFCVDDQAKVFMMIMNVANDEMKYKAIF